MKPQCKLVLGKATGIAKEHSINKISIVMIVGKFKIMRFVWVEGGGECGVGCV